MEKTFIFGHKKPDTDSVTSCIALSYLKNQLGKETEARILGEINKETKYALDFFNVKKPEYLNDVKLQLKDIDYHKDFILKENESIYNGYQYMLKESLTGIPIVKSDDTFLGLITIKDLIRAFINDKANEVYTSYDNLLQVLEGKEVCRFDEEIRGDLLLASYRSKTFIETVNLNHNNILIVGNRHNIIEHAISSGIKLIIVSGNKEIEQEQIEFAKRKKVNLIVSSYDSFHIAKLIMLSNYIKTMITSYNPIRFEDTDYVNDVLEVNEKLRHTNYPVVDKNEKCLGLLRITDLNSKHPKKVILVDHSEKLQSADGIEEAEILEIVDHHNLGSITTSQPINFRSMAVGSTCTIVYLLFKEKNIEIPKHIAGMLLSGVLSDTLILKSPTTTEKDKEIVPELSKIAGVEYEEYGMNLLKAGTSIEGMSVEDVLYNDYKLYTVNGKSFAIGQFFTMNFDDIKTNQDEYIKVLDEVSEANNHAIVALYVTDIVQNGSYVLYNTKGKNIMDMAYEKDSSEGMFIEECVSRKKNVIPIIMDVLEN